MVNALGEASHAGIRWGTPQARWVLSATVGASGLAMLDATTVNVALPAVGAELGARVAGLQWTIRRLVRSIRGRIIARMVECFGSEISGNSRFLAPLGMATFLV
jgi:hypothetical protein